MALVQSIDDWTAHQTEPSALGFIRHAFRGAKRSYRVGLPVLLIGALLVCEELFFLHQRGLAAGLLLGLVSGFSLCFLALLPWIFPIAVLHPSLPPHQTYLYAVRYAWAHSWTDGLLMSLWLMGLALSVFIPFLVIVIVPVSVVTGSYWLIRRVAGEAL